MRSKKRSRTIRWNSATGGYHITDDLSTGGTQLVRNGVPHPVPSFGAGVRVVNEDEILVGRSKIVCVLEPKVG